MENKPLKIKDPLFHQIRLFPKIDLHAHLNGSVRKSTLISLLPESEREKIEKLYSSMDFQTAMLFFNISSKIASSLEIVRRITKEMIEDWQSENVIYLEVRTSLKSTSNYTKKEYLNAILEEISESNSKNEIITKLILSLDRTKPIDEFNEIFSIFKSIENPNLKSIIVGIDYCGNEYKEAHKYHEIIPIFQKFRDENLKITLHMGEIPNYQKFPFDKFIPDRISHTHFFTDKDRENYMNLSIPIEICPTSSLLCTHSKSYQDIPFKDIYNHQIKNDKMYNLISINTDDTLLLHTNITNEYYEVAKNYNFDINQMKLFVENSIMMSFEKDEIIKEKLINKVNQFNMV